MEDQVASQEQFVTPSQKPQQGMYYSDPNGPRYNNPAEFDEAERQRYEAAQREQQEVAAKLAAQQFNKPQPQPEPIRVPEVSNFAALKQKALQDAIEQVTQKKLESPQIPIQQTQTIPKPNVVYVRRNLTIAELVLIFTIAVFGVLGVQAGVGFVSDILPRIEIRDK